MELCSSSRVSIDHLAASLSIALLAPPVGLGRKSCLGRFTDVGYLFSDNESNSEMFKARNNVLQPNSALGLHGSVQKNSEANLQGIHRTDDIKPGLNYTQEGSVC